MCHFSKKRTQSTQVRLINDGDGPQVGDLLSNSFSSIQISSKMLSAKGDLPQKTVLQIKQDDKFFCRLLSKESSMSNPSFRNMAVSVPFVWESQPGTPKYTFSDTTLPPLTPPPSYFVNSITKNKPVKTHSRSKLLLLSLFPKLSSLKKTMMSPSSPSSFSSPSSSSRSSSDSSKVVVPVGKDGRRYVWSYGSSFDFRGDDHEEESATSPTSTLCFGIPRSASTLATSGFRGSSRR
ncbi:hypothetical protein RJT34_17724 [Clitoria ternatea]|uniref:Uncharacterized protein n=1 Tax=Clitoria ternatea TaxID=43366 RepID=A0AAN9PF47_CLITE